jgi:tRNA A37 threonylcarbamoyladenosine synthetase subunit TsaC/SUA5/YrdC
MSPDGAAPRETAAPHDVRRALREGAAVVLPNPAPLTCVVTATRPHTVNEAKARPAGQPVALWAHHPGTLDAVTARTALDAAGTALAGRLLAEEHLTLLLPLRAGAEPPAWLAPACKDGWTLLFGARWQPLAPLLDEHPVLYVSSANRTGRPPAATPAEALAMFPASVPVLRPPLRADDAPGGPDRRATTTVALHPDGRLTLHRHGAQNQPYPHPDDYLAHLRTRYAPSRA